MEIGHEDEILGMRQEAWSWGLEGGGTSCVGGLERGKEGELQSARDLESNQILKF